MVMKSGMERTLERRRGEDVNVGETAGQTTWATDRVAKRRDEMCNEKDEYQRGESCPNLVKGPFPKRAIMNLDEKGETVNLTNTLCDKMSLRSVVFKVWMGKEYE